MNTCRYSIMSRALSLCMIVAVLSSLYCSATDSSIKLKPESNVEILDRSFLFVECLPPDTGYTRLTFNKARIQEEKLTPYIVGQDREIQLHPIFSRRTKGTIMSLSELPSPGKWQLDIPEGYFVLDSPTKELEAAPTDTVQYISLTAKEAWHTPGSAWIGQGIFTIHDDDAIDSFIHTSKPATWMRGGYLTTMYPLLASLGIKGNIAAEGTRMGFTDNPPALNDNAIIMKKLHDEKGWEIMSHTMTARYYNRNWYVESLNSKLADKILREGTYSGMTSNNTTSVYDAETRKQYQVNRDKTGWVETTPKYIKAYVRDYSTGKVMMYNPLFSVDYQYGEWFRLAREFGFDAKTWTSSGGIISHANVREINEICPWGFADLEQNGINVPPFGATVTRMSVDGLYLEGYKGEQDPDNRFNEKQFKFYKSKIDEAAEKGGWVVFSMHAYRPSYYNYLPGALVSEGGTYPDEWVYPVRSIDEYPDTYLDAPVEKGINDWSEWYPCPGTRLEMIWELCKYAMEKGMLPVTSSEGFEMMGNKVNKGLFTKGGMYDIDREGIIGTREKYPHYVVGANGEQYYYNCEDSGLVNDIYNLIEEEISIPTDTLDIYDRDGTLLAVSPDGLRLKVRSLSALRNGIWIVNGRKIIVNK